MWEPNLGNVYDDLEACDDGNNVSGDGCSGNCLTIEPRWVCANVPMLKTNCTYTPCGNAYYDTVNASIGVVANEQCDDGNT